MKPDWKDAPEWAQWLVMEQDGCWYWVDRKPTLRRDEWGMNRFTLASPSPLPDWQKTLEPRP